MKWLCFFYVPRSALCKRLGQKEAIKYEFLPVAIRPVGNIYERKKFVLIYFAIAYTKLHREKNISLDFHIEN